MRSLILVLVALPLVLPGCRHQTAPQPAKALLADSAVLTIDSPAALCALTLDTINHVTVLSCRLSSGTPQPIASFDPYKLGVGLGPGEPNSTFVAWHGITVLLWKPSSAARFSYQASAVDASGNVTIPVKTGTVAIPW